MKKTIILLTFLMAILLFVSNIEASNIKLSKSKSIIIFNIPSLIGKKIVVVRNILGPPTEKKSGYLEPTKEQLQLGLNEWENTFKKHNETLIVKFNPITRNVIDFFIPGNNKQHVLAIGNLKENSKKYQLTIVNSIKNPSEITGIIITPSN